MELALVIDKVGVNPPVVARGAATDILEMYDREGMSAATKALNPGAPGAPLGPASTVLAAALDSAKLNAGVVVGLVTEVVNSGDRLPALKLVTVPPKDG